jgi:hypothetical protein
MGVIILNEYFFDDLDVGDLLIQKKATISLFE